VTAADVKGLVQSAIFTRGPGDLHHTALWIGGANVAEGEQMLAEAKKAFFGPFQVSVMVDSNGSNTTAATAAAKLQQRTEWQGGQVLVIGLGPVGQRAALLLARAGYPVTATTLPAKLVGERFNAELSQSSLASLRRQAEGVDNLQAVDASEGAALDENLAEAAIVLTAGPAGVQLLRRETWTALPALKALVDFSLAEPAGIEGVKPGDDFKERDGRLTLGPLGIGNPKMKVHKACVAKLFERNDQIFDADGIYRVASEIL
jgi:hypothetical protein